VTLSSADELAQFLEDLVVLCVAARLFLRIDEGAVENDLENAPLGGDDRHF
jgi:hypothetical protein